jgi:hypothetical protein
MLCPDPLFLFTFTRSQNYKSIWSCYRMGTIPRAKGFPIEGKKHMKELKNKFDMGPTRSVISGNFVV